MPTKNFGPLVSGYLIPDQYGWETTVFQAGKPVLDKELNLAQDLDIGAGQEVYKTGMPSGWISRDFLRVSDPTPTIFTQVLTANALRVPDLLAHVNGWLVNVTRTNSDTTLGQDVNQLDLGAGPAGAGAHRTDLVVLEVWRKLIAAAPSSDGKSPSGLIWFNGNVKLGVTDDITFNLTDNLLDAMVGSETTKRVQIQYRLRVIQNVDLFTYPRGLDDPSIVARSVPVSPLSPDGAITIWGYTNMGSVSGDPGLWRAGDGIPANSLSTVDGYMYAIPLLAVFRRNTATFAKDTNNNGGVAYGGVSDRPDGFFYDIVEARDVADLRTGVSLTGWNYAEVLEKNVNYILDNVLRSEWVSTSPQGGGNDGHTVFWADEINVDTPGAQLIGDSDRVRRTYTDRSVYEIVTAVIQPPVGGWVDGATFNIDPTSMEIFPFAAGFNWAAHASADAIWTDIIAAQWIGPAGGPFLQNYEAKSHFQLVQDLGAMPAVAVNITLDNAVTVLGLLTEPLYVDILVAYPGGQGLTKTPTDDWGTSSITLNDPILPALLAAPANFSAMTGTNGFDYPHREVRIQYETVPVNFRFYADWGGPTRSFRLPERALSVVTFQNESWGVQAVSLDSTGRIVTLTNILDPDFLPADILNITYVALRPMPQVGEEMTIYYEARAPQAVRSSLLGTSLTVIPRYVSNKMYVLTAGSGSQGEGYPFPYGYNQTGGIYPTSTGVFAGEHELSALVNIAVTDFSAETGMLQLPVLVGYVPNPEEVTFLRDVSDTDVEGRSFFKSVPAPGYVPNAYGKGLSDSKRHKVVYPVLVELAADSFLGGKGQLVVVLIIRWAVFDEVNGVWFDPALTANTTTACVFRTRGNLLDRSMF
jgi:hypothetical protein